MCTYMHACIYIYIDKEIERERDCIPYRVHVFTLFQFLFVHSFTCDTFPSFWTWGSRVVKFQVSVFYCSSEVRVVFRFWSLL